MRIRVLLADDQLLFVENLKLVMEASDRSICVVGIAADGHMAISKTRNLRPDIVLMDVRMPKLDGVGATKIIKSEMPQTAIIMLTVFDDDDYVLEALELGASGYLLKNINPVTLISAIHAVYNGTVLVSPSVAEKIVGTRNGLSSPAGEPDAWVATLGNREKQVLLLLIEHFSNREIAERLCLTETTVRNYVSTIYDKLGAEDRFQAIRIAQYNRRFLHSE